MPFISAARFSSWARDSEFSSTRATSISSCAIVAAARPQCEGRRAKGEGRRAEGDGGRREGGGWCLEVVMRVALWYVWSACGGGRWVYGVWRRGAVVMRSEVVGGCGAAGEV